MKKTHFLLLLLPSYDTTRFIGESNPLNERK